MNFETLKRRVTAVRPWRLKCAFNGKELFVAPYATFRAGTKFVHRWIVSMEGAGCISIDSRLPVDPFDLRHGKFGLNDAMLISALLNMLFEHQDFNEALVAEMGVTKNAKELPPLPLPDSGEEPEEKFKPMLYLSENSEQSPEKMHPGAQPATTTNETEATHTESTHTGKDNEQIK